MLDGAAFARWDADNIGDEVFLSLRADTPESFAFWNDMVIVDSKKLKRKRQQLVRPKLLLLERHRPHRLLKLRQHQLHKQRLLQQVKHKPHLQLKLNPPMPHRHPAKFSSLLASLKT